MERDPRDLLQAAAPEVDSDPDLAVIERRARRRRAGHTLAVVAAIAVGAVAVVGVGLTLAGSDDARPVISEVPPSEPAQPEGPDPEEGADDAAGDDPVPAEPSQSAAEARRDGVLPEVAALPFELRVNVELAALHPDAQVRIEADEGVWVVSRPDRSQLDLGDPTVGDVSGLYGRDFVDLSSYGEVLLLDAQEQRILRAYPFPGLAPQALAMDDGAVFCTRQGDGGVPDSMLCRVDRGSLDPTVRVFPWTDSSPYLDPSQIHLPDRWSVADPIQEVLFGELRILDGDLVSIGQAGQVRVDRQTLELLDGPDGQDDAGDDPTAVTSEDEQLVAAFLRFADEPSAGAFEALPFASEVALGLGSELPATRTATELEDPDAWSLDVDDFRGYAGPFSALELARDTGATDVSVGDYDRCVAPPTPAPDQVAGLRRVSVQPQLGPQESCLRWWSVDLYLDDGRIVAVSLDLYDP